jgi:ferredoxin
MCWEPAFQPTTSPLEEKAHASVFIAGGIGITPILSMIERLDAIDRPWCLYYAARSPEVAAFRERLNALDRGRERVRLCFSSAGSQRLDLAQIVRNAPAGTHFYCCGPTRMIDAFVVATSQCEPETVHFERFAASEAAAVEGGFTIRLQRSGRSIPVLQGQTILDALLDANAPVSYACSTGICGTCLTRVVEGEPDHRDDFLSDDEKRAGKTMIICCSGSKSPELVLDL